MLIVAFLGFAANWAIDMCDYTLQLGRSLVRMLDNPLLGGPS